MNYSTLPFFDSYILILLFGTIINTVAIVQMGIDKCHSMTRKFRISEKRLLIPVLFGGIPGVLAGIYLFRHKTQKTTFHYKLLIFTIVFISGFLVMWESSILYEFNFFE